MLIKLIFDDWKRHGQSIYHTEECINLSMGDFHSGTTFDGIITLDPEQHEELQRALKAGYTPSFLMMEGKP